VIINFIIVNIVIYRRLREFERNQITGGYRNESIREVTVHETKGFKRILRRLGIVNYEFVVYRNERIQADFVDV